MSVSVNNVLRFDNKGPLYCGLVCMGIGYLIATIAYASNPVPLDIQKILAPSMGFAFGLVVFWAAYLIKGRAFRDQQIFPDLIRSLFVIGGIVATLAVLGLIVGSQPKIGNILIIVAITIGLALYLRKNVQPVDDQASITVHSRLAEKYDKRDLLGGVAGFAVGALLVAMGSEPNGDRDTTMGIILGGAFCSMFGVAVARRIEVARQRPVRHNEPKQERKEQPRHEHRERQRQERNERARQEGQRQERASEQTRSSNDQKARNEGSGSSSSPRPDAPEMPYGVDKRHPDDVKFWAIVDDPNASDGERSNAFGAILKRSAKRKSKNEGASS